MSTYDCGYKDGYKSAIDDMVAKLHEFGLKANIEFASTEEYFESVILLVEFYKLQYERCLNEIFENHSSEETVTCSCEFCEQWRILEVKI
jgi:hypothetical protein